MLSVWISQYSAGGGMRLPLYIIYLKWTIARNIIPENEYIIRSRTIYTLRVVSEPFALYEQTK